MSSCAEITTKLNEFDDLISKDDIDAAAIIFGQLAELLHEIRFDQSISVEQVDFYQELNRRLTMQERALAARQNEIKMLLIPFNKRSQVAHGEVYSGRRK